MTELGSNNTALVTGGSGFLGRAIVKMLLNKGVKVHILSRGKYPDLEEAGCKVFQGEISDEKAVEEAAKGCDIVFHTAAKAGVAEPYSEYERINYRGTLVVIETCKKLGITKLVYTSTPSVAIGSKGILNGDESLPYPPNHTAYYPKTKTMAEQAVLIANGPKLSTVALRPHLMWGPGDNHLVPRLVRKTRAGKMKFVGDGKNIVDTTFIDNAAEAHILAAEHLAPDAACAGKAYFITNGEPTPISEITNKLIATAGCGPVTATIPFKLAYGIGVIIEWIYRTFQIKSEQPITPWMACELAHDHSFSIEAAKRDFGYVPRISIEEGLKILAEHYKEHPIK